MNELKEKTRYRFSIRDVLTTPHSESPGRKESDVKHQIGQCMNYSEEPQFTHDESRRQPLLMALTISRRREKKGPP